MKPFAATAIAASPEARRIRHERTENTARDTDKGLFRSFIQFVSAIALPLLLGPFPLSRSLTSVIRQVSAIAAGPPALRSRFALYLFDSRHPRSVAKVRSGKGSACLILVLSTPGGKQAPQNQPISFDRRSRFGPHRER